MPMDMSKGAYIESMKKLTIEETSKMMQLDEEPSWIDPLVCFLKNGTLPVH